MKTDLLCLSRGVFLDILVTRVTYYLCALGLLEGSNCVPSTSSFHNLIEAKDWSWIVNHFIHTIFNPQSTITLIDKEVWPADCSRGGKSPSSDIKDPMKSGSILSIWSRISAYGDRPVFIFWNEKRFFLYNFYPYDLKENALFKGRQISTEPCSNCGAFPNLYVQLLFLRAQFRERYDYIYKPLGNNLSSK